MSSTTFVEGAVVKTKTGPIVFGIVAEIEGYERLLVDWEDGLTSGAHASMIEPVSRGDILRRADASGLPTFYPAADGTFELYRNLLGA